MAAVASIEVGSLGPAAAIDRVGRVQPIAQLPAGLGAQVDVGVGVLRPALPGVGDRRRDSMTRQMVGEVAADPQLVERDLVVRYVPPGYQPMNRRGGFRQARGVAQHDLEHAPVVENHDAGTVAAHSLGQIAGDPPGEVDGMSRRDLRPLLFAVVIKPREIDQLFGVHIGDAGVDVRPHPE